jgi:diguanylate cyclase (GGDEF)-like protein
MLLEPGINVSQLIRKFRLTQVVLVLAPMAVLTLLLGIILLTFFLSNNGWTSSMPAFVIAGLAAYGATIFVLGRASLASARKLERLGQTDSLTNLPNRRALHLDIQFDARDGEEIALALVDLDGFKRINDQYGHFVGDKLIGECAKILTDLCEPEARCYRLGGDEFAIVMIGPLAGTILEGICRGLIERLSRPVAINERRLTIGASIGLSRSSGSDGISSSELLRRSDVAMYASKSGGKMRCTWFSDDFDRNREAKAELEDELRQALANEEFIVHYQPLVDADSHEIVAVEALVRWNRPDGRAIGPNIFIPVAEETGLINSIGLWVLRKACHDAMAWDEIMLSVNISAAQLRNPEFPVQLGQILEESGFPANRLELEITETCLVLDPEVAERSLDVIRGFGVNVSLDDFGTGYASIGFLRQFRFEKLKLDRSLVVQAGEDDGSRAMMLSSVTVAHALKMGVTAEGVETNEQAQLARSAGCDRIQGWLFHKAMPADEISSHLATEQGLRGHAPLRIRGRS